MELYDYYKISMSEQSNADSFEQTITSLVYSKYHSLRISGKPQEHEWTVLASIIEERDGKFNVIVITTGTKCVGIAYLPRVCL